MKRLTLIVIIVACVAIVAAGCARRSQPVVASAPPPAVVEDPHRRTHPEFSLVTGGFYEIDNSTYDRPLRVLGAVAYARRISGQGTHHLVAHSRPARSGQSYGLIARQGPRIAISTMARRRSRRFRRPTTAVRRRVLR